MKWPWEKAWGPSVLRVWEITLVHEDAVVTVENGKGQGWGEFY